MRSTASWVARYGVMVALAIILSYVELLFPINFVVPGVKLGLANLVTIVGLYLVGERGTACVTFTRIILVYFLFGRTFGLMYSLFGGGVSFLLMVFAKRRGWFGTVGVSIIGGIGHNLGQNIAANILVGTGNVFAYFPVLLAAGTAAGSAIGLLGGILISRTEKYIKNL